MTENSTSINSCEFMREFVETLKFGIKDLSLAQILLLVNELITLSAHKLEFFSAIHERFTCIVFLCDELIESLKEFSSNVSYNDLLARNIEMSKSKTVLDSLISLGESDAENASFPSDLENAESGCLSDLSIIELYDNVLIDFSLCVEDALSAFAKREIRERIPGVLELDIVDAKKAVDLCEGNYRLR